MDYSRLLYAAAVRELAYKWLRNDMPEDIPVEEVTKWRDDRTPDYIRRAASELEWIAQLLEQDKAKP